MKRKCRIAVMPSPIVHDGKMCLEYLVLSGDSIQIGRRMHRKIVARCWSRRNARLFCAALNDHIEKQRADTKSIKQSISGLSLRRVNKYYCAYCDFPVELYNGKAIRHRANLLVCPGSGKKPIVRRMTYAFNE